MALTVTMLVFGLLLTAMRWIDSCEMEERRSNQVFSVLYTRDAVIQFGMDTVLNKLSSSRAVWHEVTVKPEDYSIMLDKLDNSLLSQNGVIQIEIGDIAEGMKRYSCPGYVSFQNAEMELSRFGSLEMNEESIVQERTAGEPAAYVLKPIELELSYRSGNGTIRRRCRVLNSQLQVSDEEEKTVAQLDFTQCSIELLEQDYYEE